MNRGHATVWKIPASEMKVQFGHFSAESTNTFASSHAINPSSVEYWSRRTLLVIRASSLLGKVTVVMGCNPFDELLMATSINSPIHSLSSLTSFSWIHRASEHLAALLGSLCSLLYSSCLLVSCCLSRQLCLFCLLCCWDSWSICGCHGFDRLWVRLLALAWPHVGLTFVAVIAIVTMAVVLDFLLFLLFGSWCDIDELFEP